MTPRWCWLTAWVRSVYLADGPGVAGCELADEDRAKLRERFPLWLGMHAEITQSDEECALWVRRGNQLASWCGVDLEALCDLALQVRAAEENRVVMRPRLELVIHVDGASPNTGVSGKNTVGCSVLRDGQELEAHSQVPVPGASNNEAEYYAVLFGLARACALGASKTLIQSDSQLVVRQINGEWDCAKPHLVPLRDQARQQMQGLPDVRLAWVPREENQRADALATRPERLAA